MLAKTENLIGRVFLALVMCIALAATGGAFAQEVEGKESLAPFNHASTGFSLTGQHVQARCESCHTQGMFRGTPRDCGICHRDGGKAGAEAKSPNHIPTTQACDTCHRTSSWTPSSFGHQGVVTGACLTCHNGTNATGKPTMHMSTGASCDSCHKIAAWLPAAYDHVNVAAGACATCHNGSRATGKISGHIPTSAACDTCHSRPPASMSFAQASMNHTGMSGQCSTCHSGSYLSQNAQSKPNTHLATTAQCDTCHTSTTSWASVPSPHSIVPAVATIGAGGCTTCHNSVNALGKPASHIPDARMCDTCHKNFVAFKPASMDHTGTTGQCSTCHSGSFNFANALAKPATHIPTTAQCDTCHTGGFINWAPGTMNHSGMAGKCSTCHSGAYLGQNAQAKPATHVPTSAQCDTCHKSTSSWATATFTHDTSAAGKCSTCHNSVTALGKSATHIPTGAQCDTCHSNFIAFKPAQMNHAGMTGQCSTCHNGSYLYANALTKPITHIPDGRQCDSCHTTGYVNWAPAVMNHNGLGGLCSKCHNGSFLVQNAQTKPSTHVSTGAQCDTCHKSTVSWATATYTHALADTNCSTCHNGTTALGKITNHIPTTAQCSACHKNYAVFRPATMDHTGTTAQCSTCHNGSYTYANAQSKPSTHIQTTTQCDTCHNNFTAWKPAVYVHGGGDTNCSTCHNGTSALGKPVSHIPTTAQCSTCHTNKVTFAPAAMSHAGLNGQCSTCHSGGYLAQNAQTKPATHISTTAQCDTCHSSTVSWATATFNHGAATPAVTGRCSTCHNGTAALGKPTSHIPTAAQCDTCHTNQVTFAPATMSHAGTSGPVAAGSCSSCHNGAYTFANAQAKAASHIPTTAQCDTCHKNYTAFAPATMTHSGMTGQCSTCHNGSYVAANALAKSPSHIPTTAQCDTCHKNYTAFAPATMSHSGTTGPIATGNCATCHNGSYTAVNALAKPVSHIPTTQTCDTCHTTIAWKPTSFSHSGVVAGSCATCHNGISAAGKPAGSHIPTAQSCEACHQTGISWLPLKLPYAHTGVVSGTCATCHGGTYTNITVKPGNHIPTLTPAGMPGNECSLCHSSTSSFSAERMNHGTMQTSCVTCHDSSATYAGSMDKINRSNHHSAGSKDCSSSGCHRPLGSKGKTYTKWD
jgi:hypothetical protein